jgi:acylphosphatase
VFWKAEGLPAVLVGRMAVEEFAPPFTRFDAFKQVPDL